MGVAFLSNASAGECAPSGIAGTINEGTAMPRSSSLRKTEQTAALRRLDTVSHDPRSSGWSVTTLAAQADTSVYTAQKYLRCRKHDTAAKETVDA
jgi:hypothetical protein